MSNAKLPPTFGSTPQIPSKSFAHARARQREIEKLMATHHYHGHFSTHSGFDIESFLRGELKEIIYVHCPAQAVSDAFKRELANLLAPYTVNILLIRETASSGVQCCRGVQSSVGGGTSLAVAMLRKIEAGDEMRKSVSNPR